MKNMLCLNDLSPGQHATVKRIDTHGSMRRRLIDIGLTDNTKVECVGCSPSGDPSAYLIRGAVIALRSEDCKKISIENIHS